ncbi:HD domain-containing protein [Lentibacillus salicampi]|uniref:Bifunctional (P)ppGpp synthetase/guanosine-3',5'-bis(Diphosphate) 3'-pyrophosphohydrolase n=1 Tax=Lentibacillus salicampi TaxID=175306 RepID=A0A4Y9A907_9BACI|nr:HD domain-containing protein [Lentibacillus salicampi]TFJ91597.1 bifunctional (p)ppGpp synthetase/guanosine-3',5'-bis(diphosphate) 3'-pyrophosphohydrolase [Lentibacillus salicampi]
MKHDARDFAAKAHEGQTRKSSNDPYITHPIRVAELLEKSGFSDELVSAGYLHDVVEDTPLEMEDIEAAFGIEVAKLVAAHKEDKSKTWKERKQHTIDTVQYAAKDVKFLIVADKLDNLLSMEKEYKLQGDVLWENFNAGFALQKWYNQSIVANMDVGLTKDEIPDYFQAFRDAVVRVFG